MNFNRGDAMAAKQNFMNKDYLRGGRGEGAQNYGPPVFGRGDPEIYNPSPVKQAHRRRPNMNTFNRRRNYNLGMGSLRA